MCVFFSEHMYSLLWGSTVGYPSDSLASCFNTSHDVPQQPPGVRYYNGITPTVPQKSETPQNVSNVGLFYNGNMLIEWRVIYLSNDAVIN